MPENPGQKPQGRKQERQKHRKKNHDSQQRRRSFPAQRVKENAPCKQSGKQRGLRSVLQEKNTPADGAAEAETGRQVWITIRKRFSQMGLTYVPVCKIIRFVFKTRRLLTSAVLMPLYQLLSALSTKFCKGNRSFSADSAENWQKAVFCENPACQTADFW